MRFIIMGTGGVGGYFGARLAAAGHDVGFVARGANLTAIKAGGLIVKSALGDLHLRQPRASDDPAALWERGSPAADVAFMTVKLGDTDSACRALAGALGPATTVISLQNGVEANALLIQAFGARRVAGGAAYIAAAIQQPGVIAHLGPNQKIELGTLPGGEAVPVADIVATLRSANIDAERVADITTAIWRKFVFLVGLSAATTATGLPIGAIRADSEGRVLLEALMAEATAVGRARGIGLPPDFAADRLSFIDTLPYDMRASMWHDFSAGKPLELEWLSGAVTRIGAAVGVPTPVNRAIAAAIRLRSATR